MKKPAICLISALLLALANLYPQSFEHFITVSGNKLMDGDKEFRFLSFNAPNLNFIEDEMGFAAEHPYKLPTEYEIRDVLLTIKQMGGQVVRIYTIPVKRSDEPDDVPASVLAPGEFNEDAFRVNDLMLAIANELGIRIIFPFVNNWKWMGGRPQYAEFRGKNPDEFWTDKQLIDDVKKTIEYTVNRKNTITGTRYKDDRAILCWETGNELQSPSEWTIEIARYIKSMDKNHLVMDGNSYPFIKEIIEDPSVDIINTHHYEADPAQTILHIAQNLRIIDGRKPYIIGEFGFQSTAGLGHVMDWIINNEDICGALTWGIRGHREEGGFYWHSEPFGRGIYKAYHWPGFASGNSYDEINFMQLMRQKAYQIQGLKAPVTPRPQQPFLLDFENVWSISWKGSVGAIFYNIERSENIRGPWQVIAPTIDDASLQYVPLYNDKNVEIGKEYYYRIIAFSSSGMSVPSNTVGPVRVNELAIIDNMDNYGTLYSSKDISIETGNDRAFKEDLHRISGKDSSEIVYFIPGEFINARIYSFEQSESSPLNLEQSEDNIDYKPLPAKARIYMKGKNDYGYWNPVLYEVKATKEPFKYLKINFTDIAQISRIEIIYR